MSIESGCVDFCGWIGRWIDVMDCPFNRSLLKSNKSLLRNGSVCVCGSMDQRMDAKQGRACFASILMSHAYTCMYVHARVRVCMHTHTWRVTYRGWREP